MKRSEFEEWAAKKALTPQAGEMILSRAKQVQDVEGLEDLEPEDLERAGRELGLLAGAILRLWRSITSLF